MHVCMQICMPNLKSKITVITYFRLICHSIKKNSKRSKTPDTNIVLIPKKCTFSSIKKQVINESIKTKIRPAYSLAILALSPCELCRGPSASSETPSYTLPESSSFRINGFLAKTSAQTNLSSIAKTRSNRCLHTVHSDCVCVEEWERPDETENLWNFRMDRGQGLGQGWSQLFKFVHQFILTLLWPPRYYLRSC